MTATRTVRAFLEPHHLELALRVEEIVARRFLPLLPPADDGAARAAAPGLVAALGEEGLLAGATSAELDLRALCLVREALAGASPLADALFALQALGSMPITLAGTAELR
ncbi:MAG: acyl-CoA dehydrogenase, partial [Thermoanaerobaculia bacterium]